MEVIIEIKVCRVNFFNKMKAFSNITVQINMRYKKKRCNPTLEYSNRESFYFSLPQFPTEFDFVNGKNAVNKKTKIQNLTTLNSPQTRTSTATRTINISPTCVARFRKITFRHNRSLQIIQIRIVIGVRDFITIEQIIILRS